MKIRNFLIVTALAVAAITTTASAQNYTTAVGARLGYDNGITLKHFFAPASAFEGLLSVSPRYFQLTGMYEYQQPLPGAPGLSTGMWVCRPTWVTSTIKIMMVAFSPRCESYRRTRVCISYRPFCGIARLEAFV